MAQLAPFSGGPPARRPDIAGAVLAQGPGTFRRSSKMCAFMMCPFMDLVDEKAVEFVPLQRRTGTQGVGLCALQGGVLQRAITQLTEKRLLVLQGGVPQLGLCAKALANSRGNPLSRQWLFSAYVHRPPDAAPLQRLHAFYGHEVAATAQARALAYCIRIRALFG